MFLKFNLLPKLYVRFLDRFKYIRRRARFWANYMDIYMNLCNFVIIMYRIWYGFIV